VIRISKAKYFILLFFAVIVIASCARLGNPEGGPKDETPPLLLENLSTKNYQTQFTNQEIILEFDEWIKLKNPTQEIVVSPPTDYPIIASVKGKGVRVKFSEDEVLKENTTYQINFGDAVSDFTEGNVYQNLIFVFSTGDVIDSLSIKGSVKDVLTQKGEENIIVMLYEDLSDTCFAKNKPLYFSKTDKDGNFELNNLRSDTFQLFALADGNVNYIYDQLNERVGFLDSLVFLSDSSNYDLKIELFDEVDPPRIIDYKQEYKGLIKAVYNPIPNDPIVLNSTNDTLISSIKKDTLLIWHTNLSIDTNVFIVKYDESNATIKNKKARKSIIDIPLIYDVRQKDKIITYLGDSISLSFNKPLFSVDTSLVIVKDSTYIYPINQFTISDNLLELEIGKLKADSSYVMTIPENAISDIYNKNLTDSLKIEIEVKDNSSLGSVVLTILNEDQTSYVIELIINYRKLESGSYKLKIIEDLNGDGRWSPGSIKEKRQSERIKEVPLEELNAGWDIKMDIDIKQIFDGAQGN